MRTVPDPGIAYGPVGPKFKWLQAGLSSFAYRLAHFSLPRPVLIAGMAIAFSLA